jgi:nitroimidazol reductase NimA-like FMN-containing flavoprotein (pyridoxamine 5'-phosphate oxidase superfamily)
MGEPSSGAVVRGIIDDNQYMILATADGRGRPWASPVYFANSGYAEFFWVSSPEATHSRNIAVRPRWASRSSTRRYPSAPARECT